MTEGRSSAAVLGRLLDDALDHHRAGRFTEAAALYSRILSSVPRHADALHLSGLAAHQTGNSQLALDRIGKAIAAQANFPAAHNSLGTVLADLGRVEEAAAAFGTAIRQNPAYAEAHGNLGTVLQAMGRIAEAVDAYSRAIALDSANLTARLNLGLLYRSVGRPADAAHCFHEIVKIDAGHEPAWRLLALCLSTLDHPDAEACLRRALAGTPFASDLGLELGNLLARRGRLAEAVEVLSPTADRYPQERLIRFALGSVLYSAGETRAATDHFRAVIALAGDPLPGAYNNLGVALLDLGRHDEAIGILKRLVALQPDDAVALNNLGTAHDGLRRFDDAYAAYRRSLAIRPDYGKALNNLGGVYKGWNRPDLAASIRQVAIAATPEYPDSYANLGAALQDLDRLPAAERAYRRALRLAPENVSAQTGLGLALHLLGRSEEAMEAHRRAIALDDRSAEAHANLGMLTWQYLMDPVAADRSLDRALDLDPTLGPAHLNRGMVRLALGALAQGWSDYDWRFRAKGYENRTISVPQWDGRDISASRLLVWREQGVGDEILFASCYPDLMRLAGRLIVECDRRLVGLFQRSFPAAIVRAESVGSGGCETIEPPDADFHIPAGGVPRLLRGSLDRFDALPWLVPDPTLVARWRGRLAVLGSGLKIGIGWRSQMMTTERRAAYTSLDQWGAIFALSGVQFVNLQYGDCEAEITAAEQRFAVRIHRWDDLNLKDDFENAAALIAGLDLVLSPAMSAGELAGALGVPVWRFGGRDWTQLGTGIRPWYASMRLFQPHPGESLGDVLDRIAMVLTEFCQQDETPAVSPDGRDTMAWAVDLYRAGDEAGAERAARSLLRSQPTHAAALHLAGLLALRRGDPAEAVALLGRSTAQDWTNAAAHAAQADALTALGRIDAAERVQRNAIAAQPEAAGHWVNRTVLLRRTGRDAEAATAVCRAIRLRPELALAHTHLAQLVPERQAALAGHRRAAALQPERADLLNNLAGAFYGLDRFAEAERAARRAILADPGLAAAWTARGAALDRLGRTDEAERCHRLAIDRASGLAEPYVNLAHLLQRAGRLAEAQEAYRQALAADPRNAQAHYNLSLMLLADGDLRGGWTEQEWRFATPQFQGQGRAFAARAWRGENVSTRRVMVWREQGIGDEILFASCYRDLMERAGHLVIESDRRLVGLFQRSFPRATVRPQTANPQDFDVQVPAGSLPRLLRSDLKRFPAEPAWLVPDPILVGRWRERLAALGPGLKVGIGWRSQLMTADRRDAYTSLEQWGNVFAVPGVQFVNLQYGECEAEIAAAERRFAVRIHRWDDLNLKDDFENAAAVIAGLDLVLSPAMSAGELAGALGVPVWRFGGRDWTQLGTGARPWFPTMRLFQPRPGETLADVLGHIARELNRTAVPSPPSSPIAPPDPDALLDAAAAHHRIGALEVAAPLYDEVLRLRPADPVALHLSGLLAHQRGDRDIAAGRIEAALRQMPDYTAAQISLGSVRLEVGDPAGAIRCFGNALALRPDEAAALTNLGNACETLDRLDAAEQAHRRAAVAAPELAAAHDNHGTVLLRLGRVAAAEAAHRRALELDPAAAAARFNHAVALRRLGRLAAAERTAGIALSLDPVAADGMANLGRLLRETGRPEAAERWYERALVLDPGQPAAAFNRSLLQLARGALTEGWSGYDRRFQGREIAGGFRRPGVPLWRGENLARRRILVTREQGIGDELMFATCLPDLIARAGHVVLECERRLVPLFARSFPTITVQPEPERPDEPVGGVQVHCPLGSLPRRLRRGLPSFGVSPGFLKADETAVEGWRRRLDTLGAGPKIGIAWRSGLLTAERLPDYTELSDWGALLGMSDLVLVNLQYGECAAELEACRQRFGRAPETMVGLDLRNDLDGTAALMSALDLVIAPATSTGELAAALGVPVWRLGRLGDWTALGTGTRPWFPSMRIFSTRPGERVADLPARAAAALIGLKRRVL